MGEGEGLFDALIGSDGFRLWQAFGGEEEGAVAGAFQANVSGGGLQDGCFAGVDGEAEFMRERGGIGLAERCGEAFGECVCLSVAEGRHDDVAAAFDGFACVDEAQRAEAIDEGRVALRGDTPQLHVGAAGEVEDTVAEAFGEVSDAGDLRST